MEIHFAAAAYYGYYFVCRQFDETNKQNEPRKTHDFTSTAGRASVVTNLFKWLFYVIVFVTGE